MGCDQRQADEEQKKISGRADKQAQAVNGLIAQPDRFAQKIPGHPAATEARAHQFVDEVMGKVENGDQAAGHDQLRNNETGEREIAGEARNQDKEHQKPNEDFDARDPVEPAGTRLS